MSLFPNTSLKLILPDSDISYFPGFLPSDEADFYLRKFRTEVLWQQDNITLFGKNYPQPRLTALYGNNGKPYSYSGITMQPYPFTDELLKIKKRLSRYSEANFTSCLLNLYRNGSDSNGWHADNEKELGQNPEIASISLGHSRYFHLKHRSDASLKQKILLEHGSLLLMKGKTQHHWLHQIPKTTKPIGARINLTFRVIK